MLTSTHEATLENIITFGRDLIKTGDLDPVYIGLTGLNLDKEQMAKWLIAYWCFYHCGVACYISEMSSDYDYWVTMEEAAINAGEEVKLWPRSAERRHFRGDKCVRAVEFLSRKPAEAWVDELTSQCRPPGYVPSITCEEVMDCIQRWPLFGPWIAFKAADMLEACAGVPITFSDDIGLVYKEPRAALDILNPANPRQAWTQLRQAFADTDAPPLKRRKCGPQEIETICCKWKSFHNGHYWVGKDIKEVRHGLSGWGDLAEKMLAAMPEEV